MKQFLETKLNREMRAKLLGGAFIAVGVPGLVIPVFQGVLFIAIGLLIFSVYSPALKRRVNAFKARFPRTGRVFTRAERYVERLLGPATPAS